jgi:hypothetical protein
LTRLSAAVFLFCFNVFLILGSSIFPMLCPLRVLFFCHCTLTFFSFHIPESHFDQSYFSEWPIWANLSPLRLHTFWWVCSHTFEIIFWRVSAL